ncbi:RTA1-domain-containing protein [Trametes elegans]|nr:RTA1-domain-containing protein [Trametes elegans]
MLFLESATASGADASPFYGYTPTRSVCVLFVILYLASTLLHSWQAIRSRALWLLPTVGLAGLLEFLGWIARTKGSFDPASKMSFIIQSSVLVLAPTPFVGALFIAFGRATKHTGSEYSRLKPRLYSRIFLTCDIISLFIQGGGGGISATSMDDPAKARLGSNIIIAGLVFQLISITIFCYLAGEYAYRRSRNEPFRTPDAELSWRASYSAVVGPMRKLMIALWVCTALIYIRSIYRLIEFADGFSGTIAHTQVLFNVFDGLMVTLAMLTLNAVHPGMLLREADVAGTRYATGMTDRHGRRYGDASTKPLSP